MNINHYPPVSVVGEPEPGQFRIGPHTDFGTVTILDREPGAGGLQVYSEDGGWEDAPYDPEALTVNIGDLLEYWSGRRWPSGRHRVLPPQPDAPEEDLVSLIYFYEANHDALVTPLAPPVGKVAGLGPGDLVDVHQGTARRDHRRLSAGRRTLTPALFAVPEGAGEPGGRVSRHARLPRGRPRRIRTQAGHHRAPEGRPGTSRSTAGRSATTPTTTTRRSASRPPQKTVADPGSLGIVLGGSGNGEQIAANKVPGARCALAWSTETASLAREHNNAQLIGIGGRMHTTEEALAIVDTFLTTAWSEAPRHQRRIDILAEYEKTHVAPPVPGAIADARRTHAAPTGPAAPASVRPRAGRSCPARRAGSPTAPRRSTAGCCKKASAWGKHLFHHYDGGRVVHVHLGLYGTFTESPLPDARCPSVRCACGWSAPSTAPICAGRRSCEVIDRARDRRRRRQARARSAAPRRRPGAGVATNHASPAGRSAHC